MGIPLSRLAKGAALLGCALACVQETSAQGATLVTGTISNFSVTATSGSTTGSYSLAGPSTGFLSYLNITAGSGNGIALAFGISNYFDLVGVVVSDPVANSSGGASGSFTMNFTASTLFFDFVSSSDFTTSWNVNGLGSINSGQFFDPGSYDFNFITTHVGSSTDVIGAAAFVLVPETPLPGLPLWMGGLLLVAGNVRRRRVFE
jgi:hypothetical protein